MANAPRPRAPRIPYGRADFRGIRLDGCLYVDKTPFVRQLEVHNYVLFIRPRRFGKTCWLSLLECYYARNRQGEFDAVFRGTAIAAAPTENRSRYLVLRFDFSGIDPALDTAKARFEESCTVELRRALALNRDVFDAEDQRDVLAQPSINTKLQMLFAIADMRQIPVYALIDEYDNLTNAVLAHHGEDAYLALTHDGFYRSFFAALKAGTSIGALERMFVTGVSPLAMDDLTSGFNMARNLSLNPAFNAMLGFTEAEVRDILQGCHAAGALPMPPDDALATMREWYNGYRFAATASADVYNPDLVLYYLAECLGTDDAPPELIDDNMRVDYGKMRHLLTARGELNGNFGLLRGAIADGGAECEVQRSFPLRELDQPENFLSLLHYFGLLSIRPPAGDQPMLAVPNQTAHQLLHAFLRDAYRDVGAFAVDLNELSRLLRRMAQRGDWRPALDFLANAIRAQTSVRDYLREEKMVQGFLAAYLGVTDHFLLRTEREFGKGFVDFCLEPFTARHPAARHGYLIELKYVRRDDEAQLDAAVDGAKSQLERYLADEQLARQRPEVVYTGLAVAFHGWDLARCEAVVP